MIMLVSGYQVLKRNYQRSLFMSQNVRLQAAQKTSDSAFLLFNTVNVVEHTAETDENSFLES